MRKVLGFIDKRLLQFEKRCLQRILRKSNGNVKDAAKLVDIRRVRLYRMMRKHGLKISDYRKPKATPSAEALNKLVNKEVSPQAAGGQDSRISGESA